MSEMSLNSFSYCASNCAFIAAMPSAEATIAAWYTAGSASAFPVAWARARAASILSAIVSKPSASAAVNLYLISMASLVSTSSWRRILSFSVNLPDCRRFRSLLTSLSRLPRVLMSASICADRLV